MNSTTQAGYVMGSGVVTAFLWNSFLVPLGIPEMSAEVAPAIGAVVWGFIQWVNGFFPREVAEGTTKTEHVLVTNVTEGNVNVPSQ